MTRMRDESGFALLEVLIAFAILAVAMAAALQAFTGGIETTRRTEAESAALAAARSLMERIGPELPLAPALAPPPAPALPPPAPPPCAHDTDARPNTAAAMAALISLSFMLEFL